MLGSRGDRVVRVLNNDHSYPLSVRRRIMKILSDVEWWLVCCIISNQQVYPIDMKKGNRKEMNENETTEETKIS